MFTKKIVVAFLFASLFSIKSFAQFTATWALLSATTTTGVKAGTQQTDVNIKDAILGNAFTGNIAYNADGIRCRPISGTDWPTVPTDGWQLDFPISPNGSVDIALTGITLTAKTSGSSNNNLIGLAYQLDGVGSFIPFGTPQPVPSGGSSTNVNFGALSKKLFNGHTYTIRVNLYAASSGTTSSRTLYIKNVVFTGTTSPIGTQPSVTTTSATTTGKYTATATGVLTAGTYIVKESGVVWDMAANPTVALTTKNNGGPTVSGNINLANGGAISGLTAGTTYHTRAYVISETDSVSYGADFSFITDAPSIPSLTTNAAINITSIKATSGGVILDSGGVGITAKGVCWSTATNPTIALSTKTNDGIGNGNFSSLLKILTPSTKYYIRAYATNSIGTGYGNLDSFTTLAPEPVIITTTGNSSNSIPFGSVIVNNISAVKSYVLTANNLTPSTGNITITAPSDFQVSLFSGTGYASTLDIPYTAGSIAATTIYVRFLPTQFGDYSSVITHTGGGATTSNIDDVTVTGKGIQNPSDFSNTGTDFWVGYASHNLMGSDGITIQSNGGDQTMVLYLSNQNAQASDVEVSIPGLSFTSGIISVPANSVYTYSIPNTIGTQYAELYQEGKFAKGIHITSIVPIVVYAHIYGKFVSGASLLLPTNTWGIDYYAASYNQNTSGGSSSGSYNYFFVIANEDNTTIEITPTVSTLGGWAANPATPYTVTLNKGEIYNVLATKVGNEDVTGSRVKSLDCNKKIAVFSGSGRTGIQGNCNSALSSDNLFAQVFPNAAWGTKYLGTPTVGTTGLNIYRIFVKDINTIVKVNDNSLPSALFPVTLTNNFYYELRTDSTIKIEADKPISVAQYTTSTDGCTDANGKVSGDPEMIFISPIQQAINKATLYSPSKQNIAFHYINVIIPQTGVNSFVLDGVNKSSKFIQHPQDNNYYYASFDATDGVTTGQHTISSDVAFNAIAYGFGDANVNSGGSAIRESYGYNAGTSIKALTQYLSVSNPYPNVTNDSIINACLNNDFTYAVTLPYKPTSMKWDFFNNTIQLPNSDTILITNPVPSDSSTVNGSKLYKYKLPTTYKFVSIGTFPVNITVNATNADGCTGVQTITFSVKVVSPPTAYFTTVINPPCLPVVVNFTDSSYDLNGYSIVARLWTFPGTPPTTSTDPLPTISYGIPGIYNIQLRAINSIGCYKDTIQTITIYPNPIVDSVKADNKGVDCAGRSITFTAYATPGTGTITGWYWDFGDGTMDTTTTNTTTHTYSAENFAGYAVKVFIKTSYGCICPVFTMLQPIYKLKAEFTFVTPQCINSPVQFTDASTGVIFNATIDTKFSWNFGDAASTTSIAQSPIFTYTSAGVFTVKLRTALTRGGTEFCVDTISHPITITPVVNITNITASNTGDDCAGKSINYTAVGNTVTGTVKWYWEFSDGKKDTTTTNQTTHIFTTAGSYTVKVFAKVNGGCSGSSFTLNQTIFKLKADFTYATPQCINSLVQFTDISTGVIIGGALDTKFNWSFGDAANTTSTLQSPSFTYTNAGTYNVKLITTLVRGIATICIDSTNPPKQIVISPKLTMSAVNVDATATTTTSLTFKWAAVTGATAYQISTDNGATWTNPSTGSTGLTHVLTGLTANTTYNLCVKALGTCPSDTMCSSGKTASTITDIFVPNAFTPNGQGASQNEKLIMCINNATKIRCAIFNQWGEKMFETSNPNPSGVAGCFEIWDGKAKGVLQPTGVYIYVATVTIGGEVKTKKGMVNLIR